MSCFDWSGGRQRSSPRLFPIGQTFKTGWAAAEKYSSRANPRGCRDPKKKLETAPFRLTRGWATYPRRELC